MTRPHPVLAAFVALALAADAVMAIVAAWHSTTLAVWLTASVLAYASVLATVYAAGTIWHSTRNAAVRRARRRLYAPDGRPRPGEGSRPVAPVDGRHARAMAAVAAERKTVPMPVVDSTVMLAAVGGGR